MTADLDKYVIIKKLTSGAFGDIFLAKAKDTNKDVVIKAEKNNRYKQLIHEYKILQILTRSNNSVMPKLYDIGKINFENQIRHAFAMERLGLSLEELFKHCNKKFSLKTVLMLADLLIGRIEFIHYKNFVHRDIKPDNFMFGRKMQAIKNLYIIDYGLAKQYRNAITYTHNKMTSGKSLVGTARYCSLNAHIGFEQSRRDDLESIGYCLVYFAKGQLPWQGMPGTKEEKYAAIKAMKETISVTELCDGLPNIFDEYFLYIRTLRYDETPNYIWIRELFTDEMKKRRMKFDYVFDWDDWYREKC